MTDRTERHTPAVVTDVSSEGQEGVTMAAQS
jgi:hypothetical protein